MRIASAIMILTCALGQNGAAAQSFYGYPCTQDCSGHEAGYQWAENQGITSSDDCSGNSNSFIEGCSAYVEENEPTDGDTENPPDQ